ncbi:MAG TPA: HPr family phosphocarrier protein [Cellulomonas sp.]
MPHRHVVIASAAGLHARPAAALAKQVAAAGLPVTIGRPGAAPVSAASLLMVMGLGLRHGEEAELAADGPGADALLDELAALLSTDLDAQAPA